jgi:hypothetical protein
MRCAIFSTPVLKEPEREFSLAFRVAGFTIACNPTAFQHSHIWQVSICGCYRLCNAPGYEIPGRSELKSAKVPHPRKYEPVLALGTNACASQKRLG